MFDLYAAAFQVQYIGHDNKVYSVKLGLPCRRGIYRYTQLGLAGRCSGRTYRAARAGSRQANPPPAVVAFDFVPKRLSAGQSRAYMMRAHFMQGEGSV